MDFSSIGDQISQTWSDVTSTGVPAVVAGAESYAAEILSGQARQNQAQASQAAQQVLQKPGPSSGIMASISHSLGQIGQNATLRQYGPFILVGAGALIIVGLMLRK